MAVKSVDLHKHPTDALVGMIRRDDILEGGQVFILPARRRLHPTLGGVDRDCHGRAAKGGGS